MNTYKQNQRILLELEALRLLIASSADDTWDRDITYTTKNGTVVTVGIGKKGTRMEAKNKNKKEDQASSGSQSTATSLETISSEEFEKSVDVSIEQGTKAIEQAIETPEIKQSIFGQMDFGAFKESLRETSQNLQENWKNSGLATFSSNLLQQAQDQLEKIPFEDIGGYIKSPEFAKAMRIAGISVLAQFLTPLILPLIIVPPVALMIGPAIGMMTAKKDQSVILGKPKQEFVDKILQSLKEKNIDPNSPMGKKILFDSERYLYGVKVGEISAKITTKAAVNSWKVGVKLVPIFALVSTGMTLVGGFKAYQRKHPHEDQSSSVSSENKSFATDPVDQRNPIANLPIEYQKLIKFFPNEYAQLLKDIQGANGDVAKIQELVEDWGDELLEKIQTESTKNTTVATESHSSIKVGNVVLNKG